MGRSDAVRRPPPRQPPRGATETRRPWRRPRLPFRPIVGVFLSAGAVVTGAVAWVLASKFRTGAPLAYVAGVNVATLGAYLYDKWVAGSGTSLWRIPEAVLHLLALAGGTPAALAGQHVFRHKTRKAGFRTWTLVIVVAQILALIGWAWLATGRR